MGRAPLLDAAAQNAVNSSTLSVATWWLWGLVAGLFVVLFCKETSSARARRRVCNFLEEPVFGGAETSLFALTVSRQNCCVESVIRK